MGQDEPSATRLFVIADAAALVGKADHKGLLRKSLGRSRLRELIVHGADCTFRCTLNRIEDSLPERVVSDFQGPDIRSHQSCIWMSREFAVGHVVAEYVEIAVVIVLIALVVERCERSGRIGF